MQKPLCVGRGSSRETCGQAERKVRRVGFSSRAELKQRHVDKRHSESAEEICITRKDQNITSRGKEN